MAGFLTVAILCGALWVRCTSLSPRLKLSVSQSTSRKTLAQILESLESSSDDRIARLPGQVTNTGLQAANIKTPPVTGDTNLMNGDTNLMTGDTNLMNGDTPSVTADAPSVTVETPSVTGDTPSVTADTPSVTVETPLVTADTPSVTADTFSVTADTPSLTADTPSVTGDTPSMTADTPLVTGDTPSVTADTPLVTVDTPSVSAETPDGMSNETALQLLRTHVEGDRMVYVMDEEFLKECLQAYSPFWRPVYPNSHATSHLTKGTLRLDLTVPPDNDTLVGECHIGIREPHGIADHDVWMIKVLRLDLEFSPETYFSVQIVQRCVRHPDVLLEESVELPHLCHLACTRLVIRLHRRMLPRTVSMEIQFTVVSGVVRRVIKTSSMAGFLRTPFWDGVSAYVGYRKNSLDWWRVPEGHRVMISWEHLGTGNFENCEEIRLYREIGDEILFDSSHCGCRVPPPKQLSRKTEAFRLVTYMRKLPTKFVDWDGKTLFTGYSLRFSFHNASARPQQLTDKTWNCSAAHWPDFKQHLQCNLLTECAGGEDEANCPYTNVTCPQGKMAAGDSCFHFDLLPPKSLTSWDEAQAACRRRGSRLPSLNTPAKWRAVLDLLRHRSWENIYIGLSSGDPSLPDMYRHFLRWSDSSVAYYTKAVFIMDSQYKSCAFLKKTRRPGVVYLDNCYTNVAGDLLCEHVHEGTSKLRVAAFTTDNKPPSRINSTRCPKGHVIHNFLSCDPQSDCYSRCYTSSSASLMSLPPTFLCHNGFERVPFSLVCDHREDCSDASDEICVFPPCLGFECNNKLCLARHKACDRVKDCLDGSDETFCAKEFRRRFLTLNSKLPPAMVLHDGTGFFNLLDIADPSSSDTPTAVEGCPDSHFQCPGVSYYCLPVYVRCNGVHDCPGHEDEADCEHFHCPGLYRCRGSKVCLHSDHVCDGVFQCPLRDDELMCDFVCPVGCTCYGLAFFCAVPFDASRYAELRFLDASGSGMSLKELSNNTMLFYLNLAKCIMTQLEPMNLVNVFHLDLSDNSISSLAEQHVSSFQNLQVFVMARNPLTTILKYSSGRRKLFTKIHTFDLSGVTLTTAQMVKLHLFSNVTNLNLSNTGLDAVSGFSFFSKLRVLDLRGCPVTYFTRSVFQGLEHLSTVYADNYKLCCEATLPNGFNTLNCHAPFDEVSSCEGLLKSGLYRVGISVLTSMTLIGNVGSFVYRVFINKPKQQSSFGLFVTSLCLSDFLMGVYSAIIGVADRLYLGNYVWNDVTWRRSVMCKMSGVLSLLSNEVSVLTICLITVDRFLVTRFPFSRHLHFSPCSARVACVTAWSIGVLLAVTPLLPVTSHWQMYSQTGICIPLPVTRRWFAGRDYSFGILIILNFVLFLVIASGQLSIYLSIRANSMTTSDNTQKAKDLTIARRLITVAVSDFLCWFPVGLLGTLSSRGHSIPGEANVVIAVFVLPLNSALNPFLYTVNVIRERRQRVREQRLQKIMLARHGVTTARREGDGGK